MNMAQPQTKINPPAQVIAVRIIDARDYLKQVSNFLMAAHIIIEGMRSKEADAASEVICASMFSLDMVDSRLSDVQEAMA